MEKKIYHFSVAGKAKKKSKRNAPEKRKSKSNAMQRMVDLP